MGKLNRIGERNPISERSLPIQMIFFEAWVSATYSDSVLERVMIGCFFELHDMAPLPKIRVKLEIECRWSWDAQSALE
jgi:hypothetical protein